MTRVRQSGAANALTLRVARFADLDAATLYAIVRLRVDIFVVEQNCPYPELDGRDTEPATWHLWLAGADQRPVAYLRVLGDPDGVIRVGRVCTAVTARGGGAAGRLIAAALELAAAHGTGATTVALEAQSHLVGYYSRWGFTPNGPEYVEDGIPHVPMVRTVTAGFRPGRRRDDGDR